LPRHLSRTLDKPEAAFLKPLWLYVWAAFVLTVGVAVGTANADVLITNGGAKFEGKVTFNEKAATYTLELLKGGKMSFPADMVKEVRRETVAPTASAGSSPSQTAGTGSAPEPAATTTAATTPTAFPEVPDSVFKAKKKPLLVVLVSPSLGLSEAWIRDALGLDEDYTVVVGGSTPLSLKADQFLNISGVSVKVKEEQGGDIKFADNTRIKSWKVITAELTCTLQVRPRADAPLAPVPISPLPSYISEVAETSTESNFPVITTHYTYTSWKPDQFRRMAITDALLLLRATMCGQPLTEATQEAYEYWHEWRQKNPGHSGPPGGAVDPAGQVRAFGMNTDTFEDRSATWLLYKLRQYDQYSRKDRDIPVLKEKLATALQKLLVDELKAKGSASPTGSAAPMVTSKSPEEQAAGKLEYARLLLKNGLNDRARVELEKIVKDFPDSKAAEEARKELERVSKTAASP
jgi:hypothetical protein